MKIFFRLFSLLLFSLFTVFDSSASHLTGGVITYTNTGGSNYTIQVTLYRDCNAGNANFLATDNLNVLNASTGALLQTYNTGHDGAFEIDITIDDPCIELPSNLCVEKAVFTFNVTLPSSAAFDGYQLNYQRCCFSEDIDNIIDPDDFGLNISTTIPGVGGGNPAGFDSPVFNEDPAVTLCLYDELSEDFGAHLPTPDPTITLLHSFYTPDQSLPFGAPIALPFTPITYVTGYTYDNPVEAGPQLQIDPFSGIVTGTITEIGYYMIGVEVHYVKSGDTLGSIQRPFRYLVSDCNINRSIPELAAPTECGNLNVDFTNNSFGADSYSWNFDDTSSIDNTSNLESLSHTFSDYGTYDVMLVTTAGNDIACSDTSFLEVILENGATSEIGVNNGIQCLAANSFNFTATPTKPNVNFEWSFGPDANIPSSTLQNPTGIIFNEIGTYTITLTTSYQECSSEETITVEVFDGLLSEFTGPEEGCAPFIANFVPTVQNVNYTYTWTINGEEFVTENLEYTFTEEGLYDVELYVFDQDGCESTFIETEYIEIYNVPEVGFDISNQYISAGESVNITNTVLNNNYEILFEISGLTVEPIENNGTFTQPFYTDSIYTVTQTVINGTCESVLEQLIYVGPPTVNPPNVFSPNGDFTNDYFYFEPYYNRNIVMRIFDRWGGLVFESTNYEHCNSETGDYCWDGTNLNGKTCLPGVYMYTVELQNGHLQNGSITLFK